jgi:hypothetical protein
MTDKEKLEKLKKLADAMYYAAQHLTTDASRLHKAMDEYHQFIINEYHKEEPTIPDIVDEHYWEMLGKEPVSENMWEASKQYALRQVLASTDTEMSEQAYLNLRLFSGFELAVAHKDVANWQKEKDKKWLSESHKQIYNNGYEEGFESVRDDAYNEIMKDAVHGSVDYPFIASDFPNIYPNYRELKDYCDRNDIKDNDKVRLIIIKED